MKRTEKQQLEDQMEKRARAIAEERGAPTGLWEMFLTEAYMEGFGLDDDSGDGDGKK